MREPSKYPEPCMCGNRPSPPPLPAQVINKYQGINAVWMPDVVGRAYGNRGNARSRQVGDGGKWLSPAAGAHQRLQLLLLLRQLQLSTPEYQT